MMSGSINIQQKKLQRSRSASLLSTSPPSVISSTTPPGPLHIEINDDSLKSKTMTRTLAKTVREHSALAKTLGEDEEGIALTTVNHILREAWDVLTQFSVAENKEDEKRVWLYYGRPLPLAMSWLLKEAGSFGFIPNSVLHHTKLHKKKKSAKKEEASKPRNLLKDFNSEYLEVQKSYAAQEARKSAKLESPGSESSDSSTDNSPLQNPLKDIQVPRNTYSEKPSSVFIPICPEDPLTGSELDFVLQSFKSEGVPNITIFHPLYDNLNLSSEHQKKEDKLKSWRMRNHAVLSKFQNEKNDSKTNFKEITHEQMENKDKGYQLAFQANSKKLNDNEKKAFDEWKTQNGYKSEVTAQQILNETKSYSLATQAIRKALTNPEFCEALIQDSVNFLERKLVRKKYSQKPNRKEDILTTKPQPLARQNEVVMRPTLQSQENKALEEKSLEDKFLQAVVDGFYKAPGDDAPRKLRDALIVIKQLEKKTAAQPEEAVPNQKPPAQSLVAGEKGLGVFAKTAGRTASPPMSKTPAKGRTPSPNKQETKEKPPAPPTFTL